MNKLEELNRGLDARKVDK